MMVDNFAEVVVVELGRGAWSAADEIVESEDQPNSLGDGLRRSGGVERR